MAKPSTQEKTGRSIAAAMAVSGQRSGASWEQSLIRPRRCPASRSLVKVRTVSLRGVRLAVKSQADPDGLHDAAKFRRKAKHFADIFDILLRRFEGAD